MKLHNLKCKPPYILAGGFAIIILLGTLLLKLPVSHYHGISWLHAFFTATSAVTVTGLSVENSENFTLIGQIIIMSLIQIGGLGFMTFAVFVAKNIGIKMGLTSQVIAQEALGELPFNLLANTAISVIKFAFTFEFFATIIMALHFCQTMPLAESLYTGLFYSISAFNNAGFALTSQSLMPYAEDISINLVITSLIIIGGLGFVVLIDIKKNFSWSKFSLNTKIVLIMTALLNIVSFLIFYGLERNNPQTMGNMTELGKILAAWFQAVTPRTAGFNTIDTAGLTDASTLLTLFLMFIGGGSLSTASGIKIGTFFVITIGTLAYLRKQENVSILHYSLPEDLIRKAFTVFFTSLTFVLFSTFILLIIEHNLNFLDVLFEVVSALGTVGLSRGITGQLSPIGEFVIILMMFIGRLGPLTVIYLIMQPRSSRIKYPKENIQIG